MLRDGRHPFKHIGGDAFSPWTSILSLGTKFRVEISVGIRVLAVTKLWMPRLPDQPAVRQGTGHALRRYL